MKWATLYCSLTVLDAVTGNYKLQPSEMDRNSRNTACSVNDAGAGRDRVFKAVLIYENVAAGARARWFLERLARASRKTLEEQMWNFDVLGIREVRKRAASAARK